MANLVKEVKKFCTNPSSVLVNFYLDDCQLSDCIIQINRRIFSLSDDYIFEVQIEKGFNVQYATGGMIRTNGIRT